MFRCHLATFPNYFNPRSREGSDIAPDASISFTVYFNPRSREGSDLKKQLTMLLMNFNPRSREGSDKSTIKSSLVVIPFQSTLPRGERLLRVPANMTGKQISIHAPARGATVTCLSSASTWLFQSTLPRGERRLSKASGTSPHHDFNPRSREGSDKK